MKQKSIITKPLKFFARNEVIITSVIERFEFAVKWQLGVSFEFKFSLVLKKCAVGQLLVNHGRLRAHSHDPVARCTGNTARHCYTAHTIQWRCALETLQGIATPFARSSGMVHWKHCTTLLHCSHDPVARCTIKTARHCYTAHTIQWHGALETLRDIATLLTRSSGLVHWKHCTL